MISNEDNIRKVCGFFSKVLIKVKGEPKFIQIKNLITQLMTKEISLDVFIKDFPQPLPAPCVSILRADIDKFRSQLCEGNVKIDYIDVPPKAADILRLYNATIKSKEEVNKNPHHVKNITITGSPLVRVINSTKFTGNTVTPDATLSKRRKPDTPFSNVKRKKIDISLQSDSISEMKAIPSIQSFNEAKDQKLKVEITGAVTTTTVVVPHVQELASANTDGLIHRRATTIRIFELAAAAGLTRVDLSSILPYMERALASVTETLGVHFAYYASHRADCATKFKPDNPLYTEINNNSMLYNFTRNEMKLMEAHEEREREEKRYHEQTRSEEMQRKKEDLQKHLSNQMTDRQNHMLRSNLFTAKRNLPPPPTITIARKKRICLKDFSIVLHMRPQFQKLETFKLILETLNK